MTGLITIKGKQYIFRNDHGFGNEFWAWNIHEKTYADRITTHKWEKLPKGYVEIFDIENPPETVRFIPLINKRGN